MTNRYEPRSTNQGECTHPEDTMMYESNTSGNAVLTICGACRTLVVNECVYLNRRSEKDEH